MQGRLHEHGPHSSPFANDDDEQGPSDDYDDPLMMISHERRVLATRVLYVTIA